MSERLDPRRNAYRDDLAAAGLRGRVKAARFVEGERRQVTHGAAPMRRSPDANAALDTEALYGETVIVFDEQEGWAWGQLERDGYVGYLPAAFLSPETAVPTHRVGALRTYIFAASDIKSSPRLLLSLNARVRVSREVDGRLAEIDGAGFAPLVHLKALGDFERDFVSVAERFAGTPYLWGGRTSVGIDCSGLVQLALEAAGIACPRDTHMQEAELGRAVELAGGLPELQRGDLVFWPRHVGIMVDAHRLIHANAHHMSTTVEPLTEVADRNPDPIRTVRRL